MSATSVSAKRSDRLAQSPAPGTRVGSLTTTWIAERFPVYAQACLLGAIFSAPAVLNLGSVNIFMLVKVTAIWIFGVTALGLWAAWSAEQKSWLPSMRIAPMAATFLAVCILSTATSSNRSLSLVGLYTRYGGLIPLLLYAAVATTIVGLYWRRPGSLRQVAWAVTAGTAVLSGYLLIQAAGLDWIDWTDPASGRPPDYPGGTVGNSNFAGGYLAVALPLVLFTALSASRPWVRRWLLAILVFAALALWCTQTRGGFAGTAAGMATLAIAYRRMFPRWLRRTAAGGLAAFAIVMVLAIWHPGTDEPPGPLNNLHIFSSNTLGYRANYWYAAGAIFADHPVLGTGLDTFHDHYTAYRLESDARESGPVVPEKPHNIFFEYASNTGALGLLSYLVLVGATLQFGWRRGRQLEGRGRLLLVSFVASLVAYLVQGFFSIDVPPLAFMGWVVLGALAALADPKVVAARDAATEATSPALPGGLALTGPGRSRWVVRAGIASAVAALLVVGTLPLRADVVARSGRLANAIRMLPIESTYRAQAAQTAFRLAEAAETPEQQLVALQKAEERYRDGLDLRPQGIQFMLGLAKTYTLWARTLDPTRFTEAKRWWQRTIDQDPHNTGLRETYEEQVDAQRRLAERLEAALQVRPDRVADLVKVAQVYIGLDEAERARAPLERALRLEPGNDLAFRLLEQIRTGRARTAPK